MRAKAFASERDFDAVLPNVDAVILLRIQRERFVAMPISDEEYVAGYRLDRRRLGLLRKEAIVMHPGPYNRGMELDDSVLDFAAGATRVKCTTAWPVRMAVLDLLVKREACKVLNDGASHRGRQSRRSAMSLDAVRDGANPQRNRRGDRRAPRNPVKAKPCWTSPARWVRTRFSVDMHVHLREPGFPQKETIATGTEAAVRGGFSSVACMPNTNPALDAPATLHWLAQSVQRFGRCRVYPIARSPVARKGREPCDFASVGGSRRRGLSDDAIPWRTPAFCAARHRRMVALRRFYLALRTRGSNRRPGSPHSGREW